MKLLISIHDYAIENAFSIGELNLFSNNNRDEVNRKVVDYLKSLSHQLQNESSDCIFGGRFPFTVPCERERQ